ESRQNYEASVIPWRYKQTQVTKYKNCCSRVTKILDNSLSNLINKDVKPIETFEGQP
ncbi:unnamed protein product, partial [Heterotrigona itama]